MAEVVLAVLLAVQTYLWHRDRQATATERDRLVRMAFADSKSERIAATLPERPSKKSPPLEQRPVKPIGV